MKYLTAIFILTIFVLISCKNEENKQFIERKTINENGIIKNKIIYKNKHNSSYVEVEQETNGHLLSIRKVVNGKMHGNYIINETNKNHIIVGCYNDDNNWRLYKVYSYSGNMIKEILENRDKIITSKHFGLTVSDSSSSYIILNQNEKKEGYYFVNDSLEIIESNQHKYYQVEASDVAIAGYNYSIKIKVLNEGGDNVNGKLFKNKEAELMIHPKQKGYKIITGRIEVREDTLINETEYIQDFEYTFYHQFKVVDLYNYASPFYEERSNYLYDFDTIPLVSKVLEWI